MKVNLRTGNRPVKAHADGLRQRRVAPANTASPPAASRMAVPGRPSAQPRAIAASPASMRRASSRSA